MEFNISDSLKDKEYRITWHGYNDLTDPESKIVEGTDTYIGKSWIDAVNKLLVDRFNKGPRFFTIDYVDVKCDGLNINE